MTYMRPADRKMLTNSLATASKNESLAKKQITTCIDLAAVFFPDHTFTVLNTHWITLLFYALCQRAKKYLYRKKFRLGWFPFDFPCRSSIGLGMWCARAPNSEVINGRKMAAVRSVNLKALQVEHRRLSSSEKWGKASPNLAANTTLSLFLHQ